MRRAKDRFRVVPSAAARIGAALGVAACVLSTLVVMAGDFNAEMSSGPILELAPGEKPGKSGCGGERIPLRFLRASGPAPEVPEDSSPAPQAASDSLPVIVAAPTPDKP